MDYAHPKIADVNGIKLAWFDDGPEDGVPLVLCHGWPEIAYSWRRQIPALNAAGFRTIVPDMRGFGHSAGPMGEENVQKYDLIHLTGDLTGLLDHLELDSAIFIGHDWGGAVVWHMPLRHPQRVKGVIGINTPYFPRGKRDPVEGLRERYGDDMYQVYFQTFGRAEKELAEDTARSLRFLHRKFRISQEEWENGPPRRRRMELLRALGAPEEKWPGEALFSAADHDVYVKAYENSGWEGGVNWYRNLTRNWQMSADLPVKIDCPCLMISAANDMVLQPRYADHMPKYIADLERHTIEDCSHWTQEEKPDELNALMVDWLSRRFG